MPSSPFPPHTQPTYNNSRGHPDAYTIPPPAPTQADIDVTGHVTSPTTKAPTTTVPAPAPTKKPRPSQNPTIQTPPSAGPVPAPDDGDKEEEEEGPTEEGNKRKKALSGFAALGVSVGAAVFFAILSTLGVALYAHRLRQRGLRREGACV